MSAQNNSVQRDATRDIVLAIGLFAFLFLGVMVVWNTPPTLVHVIPSVRADYSEPEVAKIACTVPDNPFSTEENAYGGWEWGESGNVCEGIESRFLGGCYAYTQAEESYYQCLHNAGAKPTPLVLDNRY